MGYTSAAQGCQAQQQQQRQRQEKHHSDTGTRLISKPLRPAAAAVLAWWDGVGTQGKQPSLQVPCLWP
jgi:hypothetical protein